MWVRRSTPTHLRRGTLSEVEKEEEEKEEEEEEEEEHHYMNLNLNMNLLFLLLLSPFRFLIIKWCQLDPPLLLHLLPPISLLHSPSLPHHPILPVSNKHVEVCIDLKQLSQATTKGLLIVNV